VKRVLLALLLCACGEDPNLGRVSASVRIDPRLAPSDIKSVDVWLFAGQMPNGMPLHCADLGGASLTTVTNVVHRAHLLGTLMDTHLAGLNPESNLVLAVDGYPTIDGTGTRNAFGCTDGITVTADKSTPVTLVLGPAM
jgi:hypothetical protein